MALNFKTLAGIPVKFVETEPSVWMATYPKPEGLYDSAELWIECYKFLSAIEKSPHFSSDDKTPNFVLILRVKETDTDKTTIDS